MSATRFPIATPHPSLDAGAGALPWFSERGRALDRALAACGLVRDRGSRRTARHTLELIDSFDWRIARTGETLVRLDGREWLRMSAPNPATSGGEPPGIRGAQPTLAVAGFALPEMETASIGNRAPLVIGRGEARVQESIVRNGAGKMVALAVRMRLRRAGGEADGERMVQLVPLRGFAATVRNVSRQAALPFVFPAAVVASFGGRAVFDYGGRFRIPFAPGLSLASAHERVIPPLLATMEANVAGIREAVDPEFLHEFRVALRRLRTFLKAAATVPPVSAARIRALWQPTGPARDLDVFLEGRSRLLEERAGATRSPLEAMFDALARERDRRYDALEEPLERFAHDPSAIVADVQPHSADAGTETLADLAVHLVARADRSFGRALKRAIATTDDSSDERIHALRIKAKRARYIREMFGEVGGVASPRRGKRFKRLQQVLGSYNDLVNQCRLLEEFVASREMRGDDAVVGAAYTLAGLERESRSVREAVYRELEKELT